MDSGLLVVVVVVYCIDLYGWFWIGLLGIYFDGGLGLVSGFVCFGLEFRWLVGFFWLFPWFCSRVCCWFDCFAGGMCFAAIVVVVWLLLVWL